MILEVSPCLHLATVLSVLVTSAGGKAVDEEEQQDLVRHSSTAVNATAGVGDGVGAGGDAGVHTQQILPPSPSSSRSFNFKVFSREPEEPLYKFCTMDGLFCIPKNYSK